MRLNAIIAATLTAATIVGVSGHKAFADTTTKSAGNKPAQNLITVQPGDYLSNIADANNTTYVRIFDANQQIQDPNLIYPGEVLIIPGANEQLPDRPLPAGASASESAQPTSQSAPAPEPAADAPVGTAAQQPAVQAAVTTTGSSIWDELAQCESGGNWSIDTGNGFYGGLQFTLSSWHAVGGAGYPNQASPSEQIMRAEILQSRQGWGAWPACSAKLGL